MSAAIRSDLDRVLDGIGPATVAVSGGVDSVTLAVAVHRRHPATTRVFHAVSPAVPPEATERVKRTAAAESWALRIADAGEFRDEAYLANPVNRCFFCKSNLYETMRALTDGVLLSGTNMDDLGDFRPGLQAAAHNGVRHPFVEAGIDKAGVRALAAFLGLGALADLPAQPCLSSRLETGIAVRPDLLRLVHRIETAVADWLGNRAAEGQAIRCRVRKDGLVLELDAASLGRVAGTGGRELRDRLERIAMAGGQPAAPRLEPYRRGSAFLRDATAGPVA